MNPVYRYVSEHPTEAAVAGFAAIALGGGTYLTACAFGWWGATVDDAIGRAIFYFVILGGPSAFVLAMIWHLVTRRAHDPKDVTDGDGNEQVASDRLKRSHSP